MKIILGILIGLSISAISQTPSFEWELEKIIALRGWEAGQTQSLCEVTEIMGKMTKEQKEHCKHFASFETWWEWVSKIIAEREK